jgi:hypothetical protein
VSSQDDGPQAPAVGALAEPPPDQLNALEGLWGTLIEHAANLEPSPYTALCAQWAGELSERFAFEPPVDKGWITVEWDEDD